MKRDLPFQELLPQKGKKPAPIPSPGARVHDDFYFSGDSSSNASPRPHKFTINAFQIDGFVKSFRCKARNPAMAGLRREANNQAPPAAKLPRNPVPNGWMDFLRSYHFPIRLFPI